MMERAIVDYLANAAWQVPLLVVAASLLLSAIDADARTRHRVWLAVLALALVLPLRGIGLDTGHHPSAQALPAAMMMAAEVPVVIERAAVPAAKALRLPSLAVSEAAARWLARLFLAVILVGLWRIGRAWIAAQGLLRRSRPLALTPRVRAIFGEMAARQGVPLPRLRQSDETVSPLVIGAFAPAVLLPASFQDLKEDEVAAAMSHELAHVARRDYLVNLLCQFAALPLMWHPATHMVVRRIRDTREMICDEMAAAEMQSPVRYATCLVAFALRALDGAPRPLTQAVSMFDNRILEERIIRLTQRGPAAPPRNRALRAMGGVCGMAMAVAAALLFHVTPTFAEPPAAPEPPAPMELAPPASPAPVAPAAAAEIKKGIDAEARERAKEQRTAQQRQQAERDREAAEAAREAARERAEEEREAAREKAEEAREAAREARDRAREMRDYNAEIKRAMDDAMKAGEEAMRSVDVEKIRKQAMQSAAVVDSPEFREQMAQLRENLQEFHQNMAQLHKQMEELRQQMKSMQPDPAK
jgi:beta-lactamase regulating signal transducer with metallopeptidase domain